MGRLIDADAEIIRIMEISDKHSGVSGSKIFSALDVVRILEQAPTAYDVDKVVEHLTKRFDFCQEMAEKNDKAKLEKMAFSWRQVANGVMDAIEIVKGAVKDE